MNITAFFQANYRRDTAFKIQDLEGGKRYAAWQAAQRLQFQNVKNRTRWPVMRDALIIAIKAGKIDLIKECFWASLVTAEFNPGEFPAVVVWGMKNACSIAEDQILYERLNVKLSVGDIRGETFYAGFPNPTEADLELGQLLNEIDF